MENKEKEIVDFDSLPKKEQDKLLGEAEEKAKKEIDEILAKGLASRKKMGLCKNDGCYNMRKFGSSYCQECSDRHNKLNK